MSPTVFRAKGLRFFFFSREEQRMHVHVLREEGEAKAWIEPGIELARSHGFGEKTLAIAMDLIRNGKMRSAEPGTNTSAVELANVSPHGLWVLVDARELYLSFHAFPWFREATIGQLSRIERPTPGHLFWPELDVDLTLDSIENPEAYPLVDRVRPDS